MLVLYPPSVSHTYGWSSSRYHKRKVRSTFREEGKLCGHIGLVFRNAGELGGGPVKKNHFFFKICSGSETMHSLSSKSTKVKCKVYI